MGQSGPTTIDISWCLLTNLGNFLFFIINKLYAVKYLETEDDVVSSLEYTWKPVQSNESTKKTLVDIIKYQLPFPLSDPSPAFAYFSPPFAVAFLFSRRRSFRRWRTELPKSNSFIFNFGLISSRFRDTWVFRFRLIWINFRCYF